MLATCLSVPVWRAPMEIRAFGPRCKVDWYAEGLTGLTVLQSSTSKGGKDCKWWWYGMDKCVGGVGQLTELYRHTHRQTHMKRSPWACQAQAEDIPWLLSSRVLSQATAWKHGKFLWSGSPQVGWKLLRYLVDPASSHMLVSKIKPCMSKYKPH